MALSKIGYSFDPSKLSQLQAAYLVQVHTDFEDLKAKEMKASRARGPSGTRGKR